MFKKFIALLMFGGFLYFLLKKSRGTSKEVKREDLSPAASKPPNAKERKPLEFQKVRQSVTRVAGQSKKETVLVFQMGQIETLSEYHFLVHLPHDHKKPFVFKVLNEHRHPQEDLKLPAEIKQIQLTGSKNQKVESFPPKGPSGNSYEGLQVSISNWDRAYKDPNNNHFVVIFTDPLNIEGPLKPGFIYRADSNTEPAVVLL